MKTWHDVCEIVDWDWFYIPGLVLLFLIPGVLFIGWCVLYPLLIVLGIAAIVGFAILLGIIGGNVLRLIVWAVLNYMDLLKRINKKNREKVK